VASATNEIFAIWQSNQEILFNNTSFDQKLCLDKNIANLINQQIHSAIDSCFFFQDLSLDLYHPLYTLYKDYNIKSILVKRLNIQDNQTDFCCFLHNESILFNEETFQEFNIIINIFHNWLVTHTQMIKLKKELQRFTDVMNVIPLNVIICDQNHKILQYYLKSIFHSTINTDKAQYLSDILPLDIFDSINHNLQLFAKSNQKSISYTISSEILKATYEVLITSISMER
jgi:hypothetical protein